MRAIIANGNEHLLDRQLLTQYRQLWQNRAWIPHQQALSSDSSDLSPDVAVESGAHCNLLYGVLLCSTPESSVTGVGTSDERGIDATAVECASVQCVGKKRNP